MWFRLNLNLKTLEAENASLKQAIREYELKDE